MSFLIILYLYDLNTDKDATFSSFLKSYGNERVLQTAEEKAQWSMTENILKCNKYKREKQLVLMVNIDSHYMKYT